MHTAQEKDLVRQSIRDRLERYPANKRVAESRSICKRIIELLPETPSVICGYYPLKDEVDIRDALAEIIARSHRLFLPRFQSATLTFAEVFDLETLIPSALNIPEAPEGSPSLVLSELTHVLIPGRAFDRQGNRLGRGNGGYDKWLSKVRKEHSSIQFLGVALECQILESIPTEEHDERLDGVITARGLLNFRDNA